MFGHAKLIALAMRSHRVSIATLVCPETKAVKTISHQKHLTWGRGERLIWPLRFWRFSDEWVRCSLMQERFVS